MAKKKKPTKKNIETNAFRGFVQNAGEILRGSAVAVAMEHTWRLIGLVTLVGVLTAWAVARGPLTENVAKATADPVRVRFTWPTTSAGEGWLPTSVQAELERIAHASLTMNPFDREALDRTALELEKTGWLSRVTSVRREPGGMVAIEGTWRAHAAVVEKRGERYLVGTGAELLKIPVNGMDLSQMYLVREPRAGVPVRRDGSIAYGMSWLGGVDDSIELLRSIDGIPGSVRITGVDLTNFVTKNRLELTTEKGSRIVWGSPMGRRKPGEASDEQKLANLRSILANGDDLRHRVLEIILPRVEIDVRPGR